MVLLATGLLPPGAGAQQKGYRLAGNQILVDSPSHWQTWAAAGGIAEVTPTGSVRPRFLRKNINAALDAREFSITDVGGAIAGSNQRDADQLIDGDPHTSWGPDIDAPLGDWRVTLNLGRVVIASNIVVRFAPEGEGDPFLQFKVLVWRHGPSRRHFDRFYTLGGTDIPNFWEIGRTIKPSKQQRVYEFALEPSLDANELFVGEPIESVQIVAIDSDFDRAWEVSREEYEALPEAHKGAVEYYRKVADEEVLASQEEYEAFAPERRGSIRYYRREIPRVAEIEVWTAGDNLNLGAAERGGLLTVETNAGPKNLGPTLSDGDYTTGHNGSMFENKVYEFFEDLGALYWVDTMHFIVDGASVMLVFRVEISDGSRAPDGSIKWTKVGENVGFNRFREFRIDPARIRFIRALFEHQWRDYIGFTEVLLYGEGYVPEVMLTSDLIELGEEKNLISIAWEADTPPGTRALLQTRTGNELEEEYIYYDSKDNVVTEAKYNKLPKTKKGKIETLYRPDPDWLPWSAPYRSSGADITSPSPRKFMLLRATLLSDHPDAAATLHSIRVNTSEPLAAQLVGEVWPNRLKATGAADSLSFFIRPTFNSSRQGFDEIMIQASAGATLELLEVRQGRTDEVAQGQAASIPVEVHPAAADTLWIHLPEPVGQGVELIQVRFQPTVLANSASFRASVQNSATPGFWQRVDEGDATDQVDSGVTTVLALEGNEVIRDLRLDTRVITPNGDGVNDAATFRFEVARVSAGREVSLTIYDLSGRRINALAEDRTDPRGEYTLVWFGTDPAGRTVPPGIYLARLEVQVDSNTATQTSIDRVIHVSY